MEMTWLCNLHGSDHEVCLHRHVASVINRMSICWSRIKVEISVDLSVSLHRQHIEARPTQRPLIVFVLLEIECTKAKLRRSIQVYEQVEE